MPHYLKDAPLYADAVTEEVRRTVAEVLTDIENRGLEAVREHSQRLDDWNPPSFVVTESEIDAASAALPDPLKRHIAFAQDQVRGFAEAQRKTLQDLEVETLPGVTLGHRHIPVETVGSYVPGGRYPMLASSFMTIVVPKVAGVKTVVACAPPRQGGSGIHPPMLHAMATSGADAIVALGGIQALAALAYGLIEDLPPADLIVGAGNAYVAEAKRQLFGRSGIDLLAGPTEILVIADTSAESKLVAVDLLGQAEHGPTSPAVLVTTSEEFGRAVIREVDELLAGEWPTAEVAGEAWRNHGQVIVCDHIDEAIEVSDGIAPEHLELQLSEDVIDEVAVRLRNYGSLFIGREATVAYGDKAVGTNHVLPTGGAGRYTGGLWVGKFLKTCTWQRLTPEGTARVAPAVAAIAEAEMMLGHAETAKVRMTTANGPRRTE
jgi:sulfopropanediol 3-dehydrogenase